MNRRDNLGLRDHLTAADDTAITGIFLNSGLLLFGGHLPEGKGRLPVWDRIRFPGQNLLRSDLFRERFRNGRG